MIYCFIFSFLTTFLFVITGVLASFLLHPQFYLGVQVGLVVALSKSERRSRNRPPPGVHIRRRRHRRRDHYNVFINLSSNITNKGRKTRKQSLY